MVPVDSNPKLAYEHDMLPNQRVGAYIDKLNKVISDENRMLTKEQARQIMLITMASVLYGMREYCKNKQGIKLSKYLDVDSFNMVMLLPFIADDDSCTNVWNSVLRELHWLGCGYEHICAGISEYGIGYDRKLGFDCYEKYALSYKDSEALSEFYTKSNMDENPLLFVDFGKMLCRHTHPQYDSRNSIWDGKYAGRRVLQMCDLIGAVKNMGEKYVIAPAFNLYANAVLRNVSDYKRFISK